MIIARDGGIRRIAARILVAQAALTIVVAAVCAFIAIGRFVLAPLAPATSA